MLFANRTRFHPSGSIPLSRNRKTPGSKEPGVCDSQGHSLLSVGPVSLEEGGGSVSLEEGGGSVSLEEGGGSVSLEEGGGSVSLEEGGGSVSLEEGGGSVSLEEGGGSVGLEEGLVGSVGFGGLSPTTLATTLSRFL